MRVTSLGLFALCLTLVALPAAAGTLYDNGPINGQVDAFGINFGSMASDTFTLTGASSTVTGMSFGAWLLPGDILESAEVSLSSDPGGGTFYFDGVVNFAQSGCALNGFGFNICTETANFTGPTLPGGTYWVNLQNAVATDGDPVYWDENSGVGCSSPGCPSQAQGSGVGTIPSEAFSILGNTGGGTTPEPGSVILLVSGVLGVSGVLRRKMRIEK